MKKFIILLFIFIKISCNINAWPLLGNPPPHIGAAVNFGIVPGAGAALGINDWDNATFHDAANEIFNLGLPFAGGIIAAAAPPAQNLVNAYNASFNGMHNPVALPAQGIMPRINGAGGGGFNINHFINFLDWISEERLRGGFFAHHIALVRVVLTDAAGNHSYPIPYIFVSGENLDGFMLQIRARARRQANNAGVIGAGLVAANAFAAAPVVVPAIVPGAAPAVVPVAAVASNNLHIANSIVRPLPGVAASLLGICKCIGSYGFDSIPFGELMYAHSERAVGICLSSLNVPPGFADGYSIQNIINYHNATHVNAAASAIIQIKTSLPVCCNCQNFWNDNASSVVGPLGGRRFCGAEAMAALYTPFATIGGLIVGIANLQLRISLRPFSIGR